VVVLVLVVVVGVVLAVRISDPADGDSQAGGQQAPPSQPAGPTEAPSPTPQPDNVAPPAGGGTYGFVDGFCQLVDLSPAFDILPPEGGPEQWSVNEQDFGSSSLMACDIDLNGGDPSCTPANGCFDDAPFGQLSVTVNTYDNPDEARTQYENPPVDFVGDPDTVEAVDGPWQEGTLALGGGALIDSAAAVSVLDDNVALTVDFSMWQEDGRDEELSAAVLEVAEGILDVLAQ
jgi:hypothetical protein